jgi:hypothetical protein
MATKIPVGVAPMAAMSLRLAVAALYPISKSVAVFLVKWISSTRRSVEMTTCCCGDEGKTAASSPVPTVGQKPWVIN